MCLEKGLQRFSVEEAKQAFKSLPPIFKLLVAFGLVNALLIAGITGVQFEALQNTVIVKSIDIGVYWDANCTIDVDDIDWGIMEPGENKTLETYLRNKGNVKIFLSILPADWSSPEVEELMSFSTSYQGQPVGARETIPLNLTLHLSPAVRDVDTFGFSIIIEIRG